MNPVGKRFEQPWDVCARCGDVLPVGQLTVQKGLRVCVHKCVDNLEPERRQAVIAGILNTNESEGVDQRWVDVSLMTDNELEIA